ncbi:MAG: BtaA family protein [Betaproteobacteria bacterium]|jgi:S-adenosylmethionine-diacylglycerol 3-amino-3-carboxypropyl transferase
MPVSPRNRGRIADPALEVPLKRDEFSWIGRLDQAVFDAIYRRSLVYNTCWEDPAVDRQALAIGPDDTLLVITSAGCNVLDYLLCGPRRVHAVDANPRQTALLELKLAGIRRLEHGDFFRIFGEGRHPAFRDVYRDCLREDLSAFARAYWDDRQHWFDAASPSGSFYFHGLSGVIARLFRSWVSLRPDLGRAIDALFAAGSLEAQREIYDLDVQHRLWRGPLRWALSRPITLSMLGVPHPQRREVLAQHADGVPGYVRAAIDYVMRELPLAENYFWHVYLRGAYSRETCPAYLERGNFERLRAGLVDRVVPHTCTVTEFLKRTPEPISKFVLLDHMDWMSCLHPGALAEEWACIFESARPGARAIFRSAHARPRYLEEIPVPRGRDSRPLRDWLVLHEEQAAVLTRQDRVHTYAGFHIADLPV